MFYVSDCIREGGLFSLNAIKATLFWPEMYAAATLQDFVENRREIGDALQSKLKLNPSHYSIANVYIQSCSYEKIAGLDSPLFEEWDEQLYGVYAQFHIDAIKRGIPFNQEQAEKEFLSSLAFAVFNI